MFQSLRPNGQIFILNNNESPTLQVGSVVSVSIPTPKFQVPPMFGQSQEMVVDLVAKVDGREVSYKQLPANQDIVDFGSSGLVLSDSKDAINSEVVGLRDRDLTVINSIPALQKRVEALNKVIEALNPEYAERQAQQAEMNVLKAQMEEMRDMLKSLCSGRASSKITKEQ